MKCLKSEKLAKAKVSELPENRAVYNKILSEYHLGKLTKTVRVLDGNLCNLFAVMKSLRNSDTKHQVESMNEFLDLEKKLNSMGLLALIKQLVSMEDTNNLHTRHKREMAHKNLMNLHQDRFQDIQDSGINTWQ